MKTTKSFIKMVNNMVKISTSILSIENDLISSVKKLNKTTTDFIHYDIMDGKFVSNTSFSFEEIKAINDYITKPIDVHLMVEKPDDYIEFYGKLNPYYLTIHYEIDNLEKYIDLIKSKNIKVGVSIKPNTDVSKILTLLDKIDLILVMSVEPGKGGQEFLPYSVDKIRILKEYITNHNLNTVIEVDGGINEVSAVECIKVGADILVSGSYITNSDNYQERIDEIKKEVII